MVLTLELGLFNANLKKERIVQQIYTENNTTNNEIKYIRKTQK